MIWTFLIIVFVLGYLGIAMEHRLEINKASFALLTAVVIWAMVLGNAQPLVLEYNAEAFAEFLKSNPDYRLFGIGEQTLRFLVESSILEHLGEVSEILFFLIGAMTIVELIDRHGGFSFVTSAITTRNRKRLLWIVALLTFFLSSVLDNLTTAIVMIMVVRKLIGDKEVRWLFAGVVIIAANAGGAWSPIGDVTTIMLWIKGNISTLPTITNLFFPSFVAMCVPTFVVSHMMKGDAQLPQMVEDSSRDYDTISRGERLVILALGVGGLVMVPVIKAATGLPPFMGILFVLSVLWVYTELMYKKKHDMEEHIKNRVTRVIRHIDMSTILFFLGILMAVAALQVGGVLDFVAQWLDTTFHDVYIINVIIGIMSAVVDNVPLVAGAMGMYSLPSSADLASSVDLAYLTQFVQDGAFWQLLAFCAGVGGSILIIGSAAGVVVMGLEKIDFGWYLKRFSLVALLGYLAGVGVYFLQQMLF